MDNILKELKNIVPEIKNIKLNLYEKQTISVQSVSDEVKIVYLNIELLANSELTLILEQNSSNCLAITFLTVNLFSSSKFFILHSVTSGINLLFCKYNLLEAGAAVFHESLQNISGISVLSTKQNHMFANCKSNVEVKTLLSGKAKNLYFGNINIENMAIGSEAYQNHTTLMLDNDSKNISVPSLCVKNNDVKCYHGSATSRLDVGFLNYLRSFGFDYDQACKFIIDGFFSDMALRQYYTDVDNFIEKFKKSL